MNKLAFMRATTLLCVFGVMGIGLGVLQARPEGKIAPDELIKRHLDSIGSAEARARAKGTRVKGTCILSVRQGGSGQDAGQAVIASQGSQNLINLNFEAANSSSWLKFDGQQSSVSQFRPGSRTALENFFASHDVIIKEGLVGGTLSESWPLLNLQEKTPKLEYAGIKKIGGRQMHALKYTPRKGSDLKITLFFDKETFLHVRTEYERTIYASVQRRIAGGGGGLPSIDNQQATSTRINAFEEFSDFRPEGERTLPHTYKFELSIQSETRPALVDWVITLTDFSFNTPLDSKEIGKAN